MRALILGVTGQTGSYLAEHLVGRGVEVFGMVRRPSPVTAGVRHVTGDLLDTGSLERALRHIRPDEVYNLAAVTAPGGAWGTPPPPLLAAVTGMGVVRLLEAVRKTTPDARVVHASSSAIYDPHRYGLYGASKLFAHHAVQGYRTTLHVSNAVLYSHTSPRQDGRFLAPTICRTLARIRNGSTETLTLTDLNGARDWGYAPDYAKALPMIAKAAPGDYVVATGDVHTVAEFVGVALAATGLTRDVLRIIPGPPSPKETPADTHATKALGWKPETSFTDMIRTMVEVEWTSPS